MAAAVVGEAEEAGVRSSVHAISERTPVPLLVLALVQTGAEALHLLAEAALLVSKIHHDNILCAYVPSNCFEVGVSFSVAGTTELKRSSATPC